MKYPIPLVVIAFIFFIPAELAFSQVPDLSDLRFLPGDALVVPAAGDQESPQIVRGGLTFLAVWVDARSDLVPNLIADESAKDIYAARMDENGTILDNTPIVLTTEGGDQDRPKVEWNGENWLIVWVSQSPTEFYYTDQIVAARISPAGVLLDSIPIPIVSFVTSGNGELYDVASDGSNWMVTWKDFVGTQWKIRAVRISSQGVLLDVVPIVLHSTSSQPYHGEISFAQDEYLMVWKEWRSSGNDDLLARRFNTSLQPLETNAFVVTAHADYDVSPEVATSGVDFLVVWERYNTCCVGGGGKVYSARVAHDGTVMDPASIAISGYVGETIGRAPSVTWDGTNYLVGWELAPNLFAARVSPGGSVLDFGGFTVGSGSSMKVATDIAGYGSGGARMVWKENRAGGILPYDIYNVFIGPDGTVGTEAVVNMGAPTQVEVDIATNGTGYMTAFRSERSGLRKIVVQPLDGNGNPVLSEPVLLASGQYLATPSVAWNGSLYLVVWSTTDVSQIYGRRVTADGTLIDAAPFSIMAGITPDVAAMGDTFLVVGTHNPVYFEFRNPFSVRVRGSDGVVLDSSPRQLGQYYAQNPSVTSLGGRWLATWQRNNSHDDPDANINAAFINPDGTSTTEFIVSGTYSYELYTPSVVSGGTNALIAWRDSRAGFSNINIWGRIVQSSGPMFPEFSISSAVNDQNEPSVAWTGEEYVVLFKDQRNIPYFFDERSDIYAARVSSTGVVLDPEGFPVMNSVHPDMQPSASGGNGVALLSSSNFIPGGPFASYRIGYRFMGLADGLPPVVSDIPNQTVPNGGRFKAIRADSYVADPDHPDTEIIWSWSGNTPITVTWDAVRRGLRLRTPIGWTGSETITFTATDPTGLSDSDDATFTVSAGYIGRLSGSLLELSELPLVTELRNNYPNPFNPSTTIRFSLVEPEHVTLSVHNLLGEQVALLLDERLSDGVFDVTFDAGNLVRQNGEGGLASGLYFYRLVAGTHVETKKMMFTK